MVCVPYSLTILLNLNSCRVLPGPGGTLSIIFVKYFGETTGGNSIVLTWKLLKRQIKEIWFTWPPLASYPAPEERPQSWTSIIASEEEDIFPIFHTFTQLFPLFTFNWQKGPTSCIWLLFSIFLAPAWASLK